MPQSGHQLHVVRDLCRRWLGRDDVVIEPMPPGFSGAAVYRVGCAGRGGPVWVLKSLPDQATADHIVWVHGLMRHLRQAGIEEVPSIATSSDGGGIWSDAAGRWELVEFVAGSPVADPTDAQAAAAARVLARLHTAAAAYPAARPEHAAAPAVVRRVEAARKLLARPWTSGAFPVSQASTPLQRAVAERVELAGQRFRTAHGDRLIAGLAAMRVPTLWVQAVLRDVSCDHVLFERPDADRVAGLIDFHAAGVDTPATDLARLFGSWERSDDHSAAARIAAACEAYAMIRPLGEVERRLIPLLAATATVFGLDNWFRWVVEEAREFALPAQVVARVDRLIAAIPAALADIAVVASPAV